MNGILNGGNTLRERILKIYLSVCDIHYSKYQLIKSMHRNHLKLIVIKGDNQTNNF